MGNSAARLPKEEAFADLVVPEAWTAINDPLVQ